MSVGQRQKSGIKYLIFSIRERNNGVLIPPVMSQTVSYLKREGKIRNNNSRHSLLTISACSHLYQTDLLHHIEIPLKIIPYKVTNTSSHSLFLSHSFFPVSNTPPQAYTQKGSSEGQSECSSSRTSRNSITRVRSSSIALSPSLSRSQEKEINRSQSPPTILDSITGSTPPAELPIKMCPFRLSTSLTPPITCGDLTHNSVPTLLSFEVMIIHLFIEALELCLIQKADNIRSFY